SASPLNADIGNIVRLAAAGAGAVVLPSLFEEQIEAEDARRVDLIEGWSNSFAEALTYFPRQSEYAVGPDAYLSLIRKARSEVDIPVIASLNGITNEAWLGYALDMEEAGAHALELNIYFIPADLTLTGVKVEQRYREIVRSVSAALHIPVAVKLSPYFSAPGNFAVSLAEAGARGLVLFNRFYQPAIDLQRLEPVTDLELSRPNEIRLPLLWLALLSGRVKASLAATSGVNSPDEVVKYLLAGADVVMTTSALLRNGVEYIGTLRRGLEAWLSERRFDSVDQMRGLLNQSRVSDPQAFERANYIRILQGYGSTRR